MEKHKPTPVTTTAKPGDAKKPTDQKEAMKPGKPGHGPSKH